MFLYEHRNMFVRMWANYIPDLSSRCLFNIPLDLGDILKVSRLRKEFYDFHFRCHLPERFSFCVCAACEGLSKTWFSCTVNSTNLITAHQILPPSALILRKISCGLTYWHTASWNSKSITHWDLDSSWLSQNCVAHGKNNPNMQQVAVSFRQSRK